MFCASESNAWSTISTNLPLRPLRLCGEKMSFPFHIIAAADAITFPPEVVKHGINAITRPQYFISLATLVFVLMFVLYRKWTKPPIALGLFILFVIFYFGSIADANFRAIVAKP